MLKLILIKSLVFDCRLKCQSDYECDGLIDCPWLTPNDEANCSSQCPDYFPIPCDCNKPGNMKCEKQGRVCNLNSGEDLVVYFLKMCKQHRTRLTF